MCCYITAGFPSRLLNCVCMGYQLVCLLIQPPNLLSTAEFHLLSILSAFENNNFCLAFSSLLASKVYKSYMHPSVHDKYATCPMLCSKALYDRPIYKTLCSQHEKVRFWGLTPPLPSQVGEWTCDMH